jgi:hypothetical protein
MMVVVSFEEELATSSIEEAPIAELLLFLMKTDVVLCRFIPAYGPTEAGGMGTPQKPNRRLS